MKERLERFRSRVENDLNEFRVSIGAECGTIFLCTAPDILEIVASSSERHGNGFVPRYFEIKTERLYGMTSHLADLLREERWPDGVPEPGAEEAYFFGDTVRLTEGSLRANPFGAGEPMMHLNDGSRAIMAVAIRNQPGKDGFLGILKLHNCQRRDRPEFSEEDGAKAKAFAAKVAKLWCGEEATAAPEERYRAAADLLQSVGRAIHPGLLAKLGSQEPVTGAKLLLSRILEGALTISGAESGIAKAQLLPWPPGEAQWGRGPVWAWSPNGDGERPELFDEVVFRCEGEKSALASAGAGLDGRLAQRGFKGMCAVPLPRLDGAIVLFFREALVGAKWRFVERLIRILTETLHPVLAHLRQVWLLRRRAAASEEPFGGLGRKGTLAAMEEALGGICRAFGWERALLFLPDYGHGTLRVRCSWGHPDDVRGFAYLFSESEALAIRTWSDPQNKVGFWEKGDATEKLHAKGLTKFQIQHSCLCVPVLSFGGQNAKMGVASFWSENAARRPSREQGAAATTLCKMIGDIAAVMEQQVVQQQLFEWIGRISQKLIQGVDGEAIIRLIMDALKNAGFRRVRYFRFDAEEQAFLPVDSRGMDRPEDFKECRVTLGNPYARDTVEQFHARGGGRGRRVLFYEPSSAKSFGPDPDSVGLQKSEGLAWIVIPLGALGRLHGQITADMGEPSRSRPERLDSFLDALSDLAELVLSSEMSGQLSVPGSAFEVLLEKQRRHAQSVRSLAEAFETHGQAVDPARAKAAQRLLGMEAWNQARFGRVLQQWHRVREGLGFAPAREKVSLKQTVVRVFQTLQEFASDCRVALDFEMSLAPEAEVLADGGALEMIIENLVHNAILYSPADSRVEIRLERDLGEEPGWRLEVLDEGSGIPEDQRGNTIFQEFLSIPRGSGARTPEQVRFSDLEHSGLGLYVSRQLVIRLGGTLECLPRPKERGSLFRLGIKDVPPWRGR